MSVSVKIKGERREVLSEKALYYLERYRPFVEDFSAFVKALERPLPRTFWVHPKVSLAQVCEVDDYEKSEFSPLAWREGAYRCLTGQEVGASLSHGLGFLHVQEEVSMLPVFLLDPKPSEKVLDLCAAPGNKTAQVALAMQGQGYVLANDRSVSRMKALRHSLARLGIFNVDTRVGCGLSLAGEELFDGVLVDVPCSCEGTARRFPLVFDQAMGAGKLLGSGLQIGLLRKAIKLVKPGGRVIYSTCTFRPEENEQVVASVLAHGVDIESCEVAGFPASPGLLGFQGQEFPEAMKGCLRIWPETHDTGGFFIAKLRKVCRHKDRSFP